MDLIEKKAALAALERNFATGVLRGRINGEEVQFTDGKDMARRIALLKQEIVSLEAPDSRSSRVVYPVIGRGI